MPRMLVPGLIVVGMAVALLAPTPIALLALLAVFAFVGWIAYLSWPAISTGGKLIRIVMLLMIIFVGYLQVQQAF